MEALHKAIKVCKSQSSLARALGVVPQVVHNWVVRGRVPAEYCPSIEKNTEELGQAVRCEDLRPDVDWAYLRNTQIAPPATQTQEAA